MVGRVTARRQRSSRANGYSAGIVEHTRLDNTPGGWAGLCEGGCGRHLRPKGTKKIDWPGTTAHVGRHLCHVCYAEQREAEGASLTTVDEEIADRPVWRDEYTDEEKAVLVLLGNRFDYIFDTSDLHSLAEALGLRTVDGYAPIRVVAYAPLMR